MHEGVIILLFDIPMMTKKEKRAYTRFRKNLAELGYFRLQRSVYMKIVGNITTASGELKKLQSVSPLTGNVLAGVLTERTFRTFSALCGADIPFDDFFAPILYI